MNCTWHVIILTFLTRVITLSTIRFNIKKFYVLPKQCIYVFCVDLRTNNDYFPIQQKLAGFYNRDGEIYCAVRTGSLNRNHVILFFWPCHAQAVDRLSFPEKAHFLFRVSPCAICGSQRDTGTDFSQEYCVQFPPVSVMPCSTLVFESCCSFQKDDKWAKPGKLPKITDRKELLFFRL